MLEQFATGFTAGKYFILWLRAVDFHSSYRKNLLNLRYSDGRECVIAQAFDSRVNAVQKFFLLQVISIDGI
jgi:hypothetical protein